MPGRSKDNDYPAVLLLLAFSFWDLVSLFYSGRFAGGARILSDHGYDIDKRKEAVLDVVVQSGADVERKLLNESGIDFYYLPMDFELKLKERSKVFETVFENSKVSILKYKKD